MKQVIYLFGLLKRDKVFFSPSIPIKRDGTNQRYWVDDMFKIRDNIMLTISTDKDDAKRKIEDLNEAELKIIQTRLELMTGKTADKIK